ncbi:hypothetical protein A6V36_35730 [Paraburkholderia ginsengiterrae]|uniref:Uncharacterized protein n=1 Tax=Paraburkholderia ginsengiterrae TaxID=1462993 RepID=A0A1A9N1B8_9BURK|nr:polysaccharide biosynthesis/export family protein [Paraburkholderia ginsengiterrae]OAJ53699.1 hypothetical protein A6V37_35315 [Paraburkholderia ginsengiterrae]OAJ54719.1 hypothetical protein A6V36_35730 [Paraburkholderia ginsengiterrae]
MANHICRYKNRLVVSLAVLLLNACAFAPGMKYDAKLPSDNGQPTINPTVVEITPSLVSQIQAESAASTTDTSEQLIGKPVPYRVGPGDVLSVIVWDHPELVIPNLTYVSGDIQSSTGLQALTPRPGLTSPTAPGFTVSDDGYIQFPYVGHFKVAGDSLIEIQSRLTGALNGFIHRPQVTVGMVAYRSKRVFVEGQVALPGVQPITNVPMSILEAIAGANGITPGVGDESKVQLVRAGHVYNLNLPALISQGVDLSHLYLADHDIVRVQPQVYNQVFVAGEVMKQTAVTLHDGRLSLNEALSAANGINQNLANAAAIYVVRATSDPAKPEVFHLDSSSPVSLSLAEHFNLRPKDLVYVDSPGLVRWSRVINLLIPSAQGLYFGREAGAGL